MLVNRTLPQAVTKPDAIAQLILEGGIPRTLDTLRWLISFSLDNSNTQRHGHGFPGNFPQKRRRQPAAGNLEALEYSHRQSARASTQQRPITRTAAILGFELDFIYVPLYDVIVFS